MAGTNRRFHKLLTSQRTPKKKAAEPSGEALAAFGLFRATRAAWLPVSPSRSARAQALRLTRAFSVPRFEDSLVRFFVLVFSRNPTGASAYLRSPNRPTTSW